MHVCTIYNVDQFWSSCQTVAIHTKYVVLMHMFGKLARQYMYAARVERMTVTD